MADEGDGDVGDVYANPAAVEALGGGYAAPRFQSEETINLTLCEFLRE